MVFDRPSRLSLSNSNNSFVVRVGRRRSTRPVAEISQQVIGRLTRSLIAVGAAVRSLNARRVGIVVFLEIIVVIILLLVIHLLVVRRDRFDQLDESFM